jgi:hypothetical protein
MFVGQQFLLAIVFRLLVFHWVFILYDYTQNLKGISSQTTP